MMKLRQIGVGRPPFDPKVQKEGHPDIIEGDFWSIAELVWDYTALPAPALYNLYCAARYIVDAEIEGDFVECGVLAI
jgi:hypothetical protein